MKKEEIMCNEEAEDTAGPMDTVRVSERQSAKGVLGGKIRCAEEHLNGLIALSRAIPWGVLRPEDEESLWRYFTRRN